MFRVKVQPVFVFQIAALVILGAKAAPSKLVNVEKDLIANGANITPKSDVETPNLAVGKDLNCIHSDKSTDYAGILLKSEELVFIQILFYNTSNQPANAVDAKEWASHFDFRTSKIQYVLVENENMINRKSKMMMPGIQLFDRAFILRSDSTGVIPKQSLYNHFLPNFKFLFPTS